MKSSTIFSVFLKELGIPHTVSYSDSRFRKMPFQSLFGFTRLLKEYGIESDGLSFDNKGGLDRLPVPSMVQFKGRFVVLKRVSPETVLFADTKGDHTAPASRFLDGWSGIALVAYPGAESTEPDLGSHRGKELIKLLKTATLWACILFIGIFSAVSSGLFAKWWTIADILLCLTGIYVTWHLMLKSLNIHTNAGDSICGLLQKGGCDTVLKQKASTFFGIFGWAEVGIAYFSVSLTAMLVFPESIPWLSIFNVCCLPFSFWSIWYQKNRIHAWCTMCVTVQILLWLIFFTNLAGGAFRSVSLTQWTPWLLAASYLSALLAANRIADAFKRHSND